MPRAKSQAIIGLEKKGVQIQDPQIDVQPVSQEKSLKLDDVAKLEAFMQEPVKILIMSTTDANATPYADVSVNGIKAIIRRNQPTVIRRCHLEVLARMKETRWVQPELESLKAAGMETLRGYTANVYPFTILEDKNPKGGAWLAQILAEAA